MFRILVVILIFISSSTLADQNIECLFDNSAYGESLCLISKQPSDSSGNNLLITRKIDLQPIVKSFKKLISRRLKKSECEKRVFVKGADLSVEGQALKINLRVRLNRLYCKRRARQQVYEKTGYLNYTIIPQIVENQIQFIDHSINDEQASFEKLSSDVFSENVKKKLNRVMAEIFNVDPSYLNFGNSKIDPQSIVYDSVSIAENNYLIIKMSASENEN